MTWPAESASVRNGTRLQPRTLEALFWRSRGLGPAATARQMGTSVRACETQLVKARVALGVDVLGLDYMLARGGELGACTLAN